MTSTPSMPASQRVVQISLFLVAAISILGGTLQMYLREPQVSPRLDNVHRFMAGAALSTGFISLSAASTIRQQGTLVYLLALGVLLAGIGRLLSIVKSGFPSQRQCGSATSYRNCCYPWSSLLPTRPQIEMPRASQRSDPSIEEVPKDLRLLRTPHV